ncbi:MAG: Piwi domain-containing protein [Elusimicrobiota bacterium]
MYGKYLDNPELLFSQDDPSQTGRNVKEGFIYKGYGPFTANTLSKRLKPVIIYPDIWDYEVKEFQSYFRGEKGHFRGFKNTFKTRYKNFEHSIIECDSDIKKEDYESHIQTKVIPNSEKYNIAFVIIPRTPESIVKSPYYRSKALLTINNVPCQMITRELINDENNFKWSIFNICLAAYAKIGGIPWVLNKELGSDLILGIGMTRVHPRYRSDVDERGVKDRIGFATVFSRRGKFVFNSSETFEKDEDYSKKFKKIIVDVLERYCEIEKEPQLITFHTYKKMNKNEIKLMENISKEFGCECNIINLSKNNKIRLFDDSRDSGIAKAGSLIRKNEKEDLLLTAGPEKKDSGVPQPFNLNYQKIISDRSELAKEIYDLCYLNWAGLNATSSPVTHIYPTKIARIVEKMYASEELENFATNKVINQKPWFL